LTVASHARAFGEISHYSIGMFAVLLYDNAWRLARLGKDGTGNIARWTDRNNHAAIIALCFAAVPRIFGDPVFAEHWLLLPPMFFGVLELLEMLNRGDSPKGEAAPP
jgi:hypothetical protein